LEVAIPATLVDATAFLEWAEDQLTRIAAFGVDVPVLGLRALTTTDPWLRRLVARTLAG
jgi:hypothetical protein